MASYKTEETWDDLQESFNRIRMQLNLVPQPGWENPVASDVHQHAFSTSQHDGQKVHSPSNLPRLLVTSDAIPNRPIIDLRRGHWEVVPPLYNVSLKREEAASKTMQPISPLKFSYSPHVTMTGLTDRPLLNASLKRQGDDKMSARTWSPSTGFKWESAAYHFFKENQLFARNFVDTIILEYQPVYAPSMKKFLIRNELRQTAQLIAFKQRPAVLILETLLEEEVSDLTRALIRTVLEEFVNIHLTTAIIGESLTELIMETIEPMVLQLVKETVNEMILEEILWEDIVPDVLDEEMRNVALLQLCEHVTKVYEEQLEEVRIYAGKRLIDMFLLEILLKTLANKGRASSEKVELDRLLDSAWADNSDQFQNVLRDSISQLDNDAKDGVDQLQGLKVNRRHMPWTYQSPLIFKKEIRSRYERFPGNQEKSRNIVLSPTMANPGLTPITGNIETEMSERREAIQQQVTEHLSNMSEKLSAAIDGMHQKISKDVEEITQSLTPSIERLSINRWGQLLTPYSKVLKPRLESTKDVRDVLSPSTERVQLKSIGNVNIQHMTGNDEETRNAFDQVSQELVSKMIPLIKDSMSRVSQLAIEVAQKGCAK
ncbi:uncharacterized protein LOC132385167 isoform X2 [Hypanus sabinus]|uniref:uncharacterized protein LOC132385167 isoform X2 n=1 Tax=Hypanus sabinus TaxID=79690 RepID=UPI0028C4A5CF|nr:uncharacterized protein LOC132385167 isoform X2 [Hypanus sabinus]